MNEAFFSHNFQFMNFTFTKYHYTDNRKGSPMNYLAYMIKGNCKINSADKTILVNEGDVFYIPKNLSYQSYWCGHDEINFLSFGYLNLNTKENARFELQTIPCDVSIIEKMIEIPTDGRFVTCKALSRFYDAMALLIPHMKYASASNDKQIVEKAKKYIYENLNCTMPEVAKACLISEPYLYTLFKKVMNATPNDFKQNLLCQKSIELLTTTDKTVEEISNILNFSSSSYFRKILKKHTGNTPREIRKDSIF